MKTAIIACAAAILALCLGYVSRPLGDGIVNQSTGGEVQCVADGKLCVGQPVTAAFSYSDDIGGVLELFCGPLKSIGPQDVLNAYELMSRDCTQTHYLITFSNGRRRTDVEVDQGRIVRLDDNPAKRSNPSY